jgi:trans-aconitate methyltransferase
MDKKTQTVATYNTSAQALADKFDTLGARKSDIYEIFMSIETNEPIVLEIGCGNGRDAENIFTYSHNYTGIDISEKLIELAQKKVPRAKFEVADIESYVFPKKYDVVFAFASLIHVPENSLGKILDKIFEALNQGGVVRLSLKHNKVYAEETKQDEFGIRTYYYYSQKNIQEMTTRFEVVSSELNELRDQIWLEITLRKK